MAQLVSIMFTRLNESTLEVHVSNCHPDAFNVARVGKDTDLKKFANYALGLMIIPALEEPIKEEFLKAVRKSNDGEYSVDNVSVSSLSSDYFLEAMSITEITGEDYDEVRKALEQEPEDETEEECGIRLDKLDELPMPHIRMEFVFKPEFRSFLGEFEDVDFDTSYDYYTM